MLLVENDGVDLQGLAELALALLEGTRLFVDSAFNFYEWEDYLREVEKVKLQVPRKTSSKRALVETVNDQLKNISQIGHTRHRSLWNFLGNVASGLIAYSLREKKPS